MRRLRLAVSLPPVLACLLLVTPVGSFAGTQTALSCSLEGNWSQSTTSIGASTWEIAADGKATEHGLGNATGKATLSGSVLRVSWQTGGWKGVYEWKLKPNCESESGSVTFTAGPRAGQKFASTVKGGSAQTKPKRPAAGTCSKLTDRPAAPECDYTITYSFRLNNKPFWSFGGYGTLTGPSPKKLSPRDVPADVNENELRIVDGNTSIVMEVESATYFHSKGKAKMLNLLAKVSKSIYPSCKKGALIDVFIFEGPKPAQSATPSDDGVVAHGHASDSRNCQLDRYFSPSEKASTLESGVYVADVYRGERRYASTWNVTVANDGSIKGTSRWDCCPGPRTDPLLGSVEDGHILIERQCGGEGAGTCLQRYVVEREYRFGIFKGKWSGTGARGQTATFELVCQSGDCLKNGKGSGKASVMISLQVHTR